MILNNIRYYYLRIDEFAYGQLSPGTEQAIAARYSDISELRLVYIYSEVNDFYQDDPTKELGWKAFLGKGSWATIGVKNGEVILDNSMNAYIRVNWTELTGHPHVNGLQQRKDDATVYLYRKASNDHTNFILHAFKNNTR